MPVFHKCIKKKYLAEFNEKQITDVTDKEVANKLNICFSFVAKNLNIPN